MLKMQQIVFSATVVALGVMLTCVEVRAQVGPTVRVTRPTVVVDAPRGDSVPLGSVAAGDVLEVIDQQGNWYLVGAPAAAVATTKWDRGWIHVTAVELQGTLPSGRTVRRPPGRLMLRAFGNTAGTLFSARDSFDTLLGRPFGVLYGGGAQVVLPSGTFAQVSVDKFRGSGSRVLVSGTQIFATDIPMRVTITPVLVSAGHRSAASRRYVPYLAVGLGWYALKEDSPAFPGDDVSQGKIGYHVTGGTEFPIARWVAVAGEVQWATVPKGLGETGVSARFDEDDLGGTTLRLKFIIGN